MKRSRVGLKAEMMAQAELMVDELLDWNEQTSQPTLTQLEDVILKLRKRSSEQNPWPCPHARSWCWLKNNKCWGGKYTAQANWQRIAEGGGRPGAAWGGAARQDPQACGTQAVSTCAEVELSTI